MGAGVTEAAGALLARARQGPEGLAEARQAWAFDPSPRWLHRFAPRLGSRLGLLHDTVDRLNLRHELALRIWAASGSDDAAVLRALLDEEIDAHAIGSLECINATISLLGFQVYLLRDVEDVERLWRAKRASFDTEGAFDIESLAGAGVDAAVAHLERAGFLDGAMYVRKCMASGQFSELATWEATQTSRWDELAPERVNMIETQNWKVL